MIFRGHKDIGVAFSLWGVGEGRDRKTGRAKITISAITEFTPSLSVAIRLASPNHNFINHDLPPPQHFNLITQSLAPVE